MLAPGVDKNHPDLNVVGGMNMVTDEPFLSFSDDSHGHGTHVAGKRSRDMFKPAPNSNVKVATCGITTTPPSFRIEVSFLAGCRHHWREEPRKGHRRRRSWSRHLWHPCFARGRQRRLFGPGAHIRPPAEEWSQPWHPGHQPELVGVRYCRRRRVSVHHAAHLARDDGRHCCR